VIVAPLPMVECDAALGSHRSREGRWDSQRPARQEQCLIQP
jgi:hypothetical protein